MNCGILKVNIDGNFITNRTSTMIFDEKMEKVFIVDPSGVEIMKLIDGQRSVDSIVDELSKKYTDTSKEELYSDITEFLQLLCDKGICSYVQDVR